MHVDLPRTRTNGWHVTHSEGRRPIQWSFYWCGVHFGNVTATILVPSGGLTSKTAWRYEYSNGGKDTVAIGHADTEQEAMKIVREDTLLARVLLTEATEEGAPP